MCRPHAEGWATVHGVAKGQMPWATYAKIIDHVEQEGLRFDHVILQWLGDPSLHADLEAMVALAGQRVGRQVGYLRFDTNGILLNESRIDRLLETRARDVPLLVVFTLDAVSERTYTRVKGRDHLARVRRHVRYLLARRREAGPVNVQVQFVVQQGNAHEAADFLRYWGDAFACHGREGGHGEILFKPLSVGGGGPGQAEADALYARTVRGFPWGTRGELTVSGWTAPPWQPPAQRTACAALWYTPVVRHDGHLLMCCADLGSELDLGNVAEAGFSALWDGPRASERRAAHLAGRFEGVCAGCAGINWYTLGAAQLEATAARARTAPAPAR